MAASSDNKAVAKALATAFGGKPLVDTYWDDARATRIDLLRCANPVEADVVSYGTIGLSDHALIQNGEEFPARIELTGAAYSRFPDFPNMLSSAAFYTIQHKWFCFPGAVLRNAVDSYMKDSAMKHLFFTSPSLWQGKLETLELATKKVAWLLAVPISEAERRYQETNGAAALEELFEAHQVDVLDLARASVV